jgi:hypothetical protein
MRSVLVLGAAIGVGLLVAATTSSTQRATPPAASTGSASLATERIVTAAQGFLKSLDDGGRAKAQLPFNAEQRVKWSNLPTGIFARDGVRLGDLTPAQHKAAMAVLQAAFSESGYRKITAIVESDEVLKNTPRSPAPSAGGASGPPTGPPPGGGAGPGGAAGPGERRPLTFGADEFYIAFLGTPSATAPWLLQFGGHHLAVNMTFAGSQSTLAPTLTGAQPATYTIEGRTVRPLGQEHDRGFALMAALDETQRTQAILGAVVRDLVLGPGQDGRMIQPEGLRVSAMTPAQQAILLDIVREWTGIANDAHATPRLEEIRGKFAETYFAWSGPITPGSVAYFRIQGPTLVIEYAPQRNLDHIHTIYRDPTNDYGQAYTRR